MKMYEKLFDQVAELSSRTLAVLIFCGLLLTSLGWVIWAVKWVLSLLGVM